MTTLIRFVSTSDTHSQVYPNDREDVMRQDEPISAGGIARRATIIRQLRESGQYPLLLLDCGDAFAGSIFFEEYLGAADVDSMKRLAYNSWAIGNHDFDRGVDNLISQISRLECAFPVLCSNLVWKLRPFELVFQRFAIETIHCDGISVKIGLFGLYGNDAFECTNPAATAELALLDPMATFVAVSQELRITCDIVVCLSHCGFAEDSVLIQQPFVDVLFGGHTHESYKSHAVVIKNGLMNGLGGTVWHQAPCKGQALANVVLSITRTPQQVAVAAEQANPLDVKTDQCQGSSGTVSVQLVESGLIWVDDTIPEDTDTAQWLASTYGDRISAKISEVLGHCRVPWLLKSTAVRAAMKKGRPTPLGGFIAAFAAHTRGLDLAMVNRGGIKTGFSEGPVTYGNVVEVLGNNNNLVTLTLKGIAIRRCVEATLAEGHLQFHGITYRIGSVDSDAPRACDRAAESDKEIVFPLKSYPVGANISLESSVEGSEEEVRRPTQQQYGKIHVFVNGKALLHDEWYTVAIPDYLIEVGMRARPSMLLGDLDPAEVLGDASCAYTAQTSATGDGWQERLAAYIRETLHGEITEANLPPHLRELANEFF